MDPVAEGGADAEAEASTETDAATGSELGASESAAGSRSNKLRTLIERANRMSTANTMPMPTRLKSSPSFRRS